MAVEQQVLAFLAAPSRDNGRLHDPDLANGRIDLQDNYLSWFHLVGLAPGANDRACLAAAVTR